MVRRHVTWTSSYQALNRNLTHIYTHTHTHTHRLTKHNEMISWTVYTSSSGDNSTLCQKMLSINPCETVNNTDDNMSGPFHSSICQGCCYCGCSCCTNQKSSGGLDFRRELIDHADSFLSESAVKDEKHAVVLLPLKEQNSCIKASSRAPGMAVLVGCSVTASDWNILTNIEWIAMNFATDIVPHRINCVVTVWWSLNFSF